jgi:hypothetical protein
MKVLLQALLHELDARSSGAAWTPAGIAAAVVADSRVQQAK